MLFVIADINARVGNDIKVALDRPYPQNEIICYPQGQHALDSTWEKRKRKDREELHDGVQKTRYGWMESADKS